MAAAARFGVAGGDRGHDDLVLGDGQRQPARRVDEAPGAVDVGAGALDDAP